MLNKNDPIQDTCFIILRHVRNPIHKDLWKECLRCIRSLYKDELVLIIDDNSDQTLIENLDKEYEWMMHNVKIVPSTFIGAGEILPFYYFHKLRPANNAIILQDSMFIQKPFDINLINNLENIKFLWHFHFSCQPKFSDPNMNFVHMQTTMLNKLDYSNELISLFTSCKWVGCFGSSCIININFLDLLDKKYNFLKLVHHINNRDARQILERTISIMVLYELRTNQNIMSNIGNISIFGDIWFNHPHKFQFTFDDYKKNKLNIPLIKCWNSR